jgi:ribosomal protein S12 methylthiotransferase
MIRGKLKSETLDYVMDKAQELVDSGVKELNIIAQDSANWGKDIYGESHLPELIKKVSAINDLEWVRVLYLHPDHVSDELIEVIKTTKNVVKYFEIPMQHISKKIIKNMNRHKSGNELLELVNKIRREIPDSTIRSSFIVGYPGETEKDFKELLEFLKVAELDRVAIFRYSNEEDTKAALMKNQVSEEVKVERMNKLILVQNKIYKKINRSLTGKITEALVESIDYENETAWVRSKREAPEVDGVIVVSLPDNVEIMQGDMVKIKIIVSIMFLFMLKFPPKYM